MDKLTSQADDLIEVLEISRNLALTQDLQTLIRQIEQAAVSVLKCERATVFVFDKGASQLSSLLFDRPEKIHLPSESGIAGSCLRNGNVINVPDAYNDPRFDNSVDSVTGFKTRNVLAAPLFGGQRNVLGVLEVLNKQGDAFGKWDEFLLEVLSAQCGIAIHRQALMEEFAEHRRQQQELAIAREIQKSLLPTSAPVVAGYDIAGWSQSAEETGGDFFDFHTDSNGDLLMILADVSGHGVGPALLAAECCALQRAVFSLVGNYRLSLTQLNQMLCRHIPSDRFITAFVGYLHIESNTLSFLSAGQGPVFILRAKESRFDTLPVSDIPLGIISDSRYDNWQTLPFYSGDILVAFTDGFFECQDSLGNCFGTERICQSVLRHANLSATGIIEGVHHDLLAFSAGSHQQDDLTAVVIKKLS